MKLFSSLVIIFFLSLSVAYCKKDEIQNNKATTWYNYSDGMKRARDEQKPVIIDFYADWCKWCIEMDEKTFSDPAVVSKLQSEFIAIRIDIERETNFLDFDNKKFTAKQLMTYMGVQGLPTLVFIDKKGSPVTKVPGFIAKETFLPMLDYMGKECYAQKIAFKDFIKGVATCNVP